LGGADLVIVYSTGLSRLRGFRTTLAERSNELTLQMIPELRAVVTQAPIVAGIEAAGVQDEALPALLDRFVHEGCSGVINFPTTGYRQGEARAQLEAQGRGFSQEVALIRVARQAETFTMAYVFTSQDAQAMTRAGVDCIVAHVGGTAGGLAGFQAVSKEEGVQRVQRIIEAARAVRAGVLCLAHGGPFAEPADTEYLYQHTDAQGFVGASSIERIPIERAVTETVRAFKNVTLARGRP